MRSKKGSARPRGLRAGLKRQAAEQRKEERDAASSSKRWRYEATRENSIRVERPAAMGPEPPMTRVRP